MKNYYSTVDNVVLTFSNIEQDKDGFETIRAYFERPNDNGFDFSEWNLPACFNYKVYGFSEDEILKQERYLRNNQFLIWEIARERSVLKTSA
jgi:hypothetical protein